MSAQRERLRRAELALRGVLEFLEPKDVKIADRLLRRFGSTGSVVEAGKHQLMRDGLAESSALLISIMPGILRHMQRQKFGTHPKISTLLAAEEFMSMRYIGESIERFYLIALDAAGRLIECVHIQSGNEDSTPFYLKHVMAEVVRTNARAIIMVHNHPNRTARPSQVDIECTLQLMDALKALDIPLIDHMIMIEKRALSVRGFGFIPEYKWSAQNPENKLLAGWLEGWDMDSAATALSPRNRNK